MTGRKGRVVSNDDGTVSYESRSKQDVPLEILNIAEKKRFMDGEKVHQTVFSPTPPSKIFSKMSECTKETVSNSTT